MSHIAWDDGAILAVFSDLGFPIQQKTTKTRCGKRVSMRHIDNDSADCPNCIAHVEYQRKGSELLEFYHAELERHKTEGRLAEFLSPEVQAIFKLDE